MLIAGPDEIRAFVFNPFERKSNFDFSGVINYGECQYYAQTKGVKMKTKFLTSAILVLTVMLAACAPKAAVPTKQATIPTTIPPVVKPTLVPTKIAPATPTPKLSTAPTKEPASTSIPAPATINDIVVENQVIKSGSVLVNMVDALKPGWVAI